MHPISLLKATLSLALLSVTSLPTLTAQSAPLQAQATVDRAAAHIQLAARGTPFSPVVLMFSNAQPLVQGIPTPWGLLCLDPATIVASVSVQLDGSGVVALQSHLPRPFGAFTLSVQAVQFVGTSLQLTNVAAFVGNEVAGVANTLTYSGGTFTAAATGNRGDLIEVKTDDGTVIAAGAVQADGSTVNLGGQVPAGAQWIGLYRNGVRIAFVRC